METKKSAREPMRHMQTEHELFKVRKWTLSQIDMATACEYGEELGVDVRLTTGPCSVGKCFDVNIRGAFEQLRPSIIGQVEDFRDSIEGRKPYISEPYPVEGYKDVYYVVGSVDLKTGSENHRRFGERGITSFYIHAGEAPWETAKEVETGAMTFDQSNRPIWPE